jgi:hypothetical protein
MRLVLVPIEGHEHMLLKRVKEAVEDGGRVEGPLVATSM